MGGFRFPNAVRARIRTESSRSLVQCSSSHQRCPETGLPCISAPLGPACGLGAYAGALEFSDPPGAVASPQPSHVGILSAAFVLLPAGKACTLGLVTNVCGHIEMFKMSTKIPGSKCRMSHSKTGAETLLWGWTAVVQVQCCSMGQITCLSVSPEFLICKTG